MNGGGDYRPAGDPRRVKVHDFEDKALGKVIPYGVFDIAANKGWMSVRRHRRHGRVRRRLDPRLAVPHGPHLLMRVS